MNDDYRKSLVAKIINKGVLTPYEAIHLQHLNSQNRREQIRNLPLTENIFEDYENIQPLVSDYSLDRALEFPQKQERDLYRAYRSAATDMVNLENAAGEIGYKGLALLDEIRCVRDEWCIQDLADIDLQKQPKENLLEYSTFSYVNQKRMKFNELLESLGLALSTLMQLIDFILTDNYYLQNLFELDELECLKYFKMWLVEEDLDETDNNEENVLAPLNLIKGCFNYGDIYSIFDNNHSKIVKLLKNDVEPLGSYLPAGFEQSSLAYIKGLVKNIVEEKPNASVQIVDSHEP